MRYAGVLAVYSLAVCFSGMFPTVAADETIRAEVQHPAANPVNAEDQDVAAFKVSFDLRMTNRSGKVLQLPRPKGGNGETTRIAVLGVQFRGSDGGWSSLVRSSWYDVGTTKY